MRFRLSKEAKFHITQNFPIEIKEIIYGMILGDATIINNGHKRCLRIKQKDKAFVYYQYNIFKPLGIVGAEPNSFTDFVKPSGNIRTAYYFTTVTLPLFSELHKQWYKQVDGKNIKILPDNILDFITPISIAYWLAGDGSFHKRDGSVTIATNSFTKEEIENLIHIFNTKFLIKATINSMCNAKGEKQYVIRISKRSIPDLQNLVKPHIPPMMAYRVGLIDIH